MNCVSLRHHHVKTKTASAGQNADANTENEYTAPATRLSTRVTVPKRGGSLHLARYSPGIDNCEKASTPWSLDPSHFVTVTQLLTATTTANYSRFSFAHQSFMLLWNIITVVLRFLVFLVFNSWFSKCGASIPNEVCLLYLSRTTSNVRQHSENGQKTWPYTFQSWYRFNLSISSNLKP